MQNLRTLLENIREKTKTMQDKYAEQSQDKFV